MLNIRWLPRRQHLSLSYTLNTKLNFHSLSQPKVDEFDDFLPWLERKAGADISSALSIGKSAYGTSLFASKSIRAGDCVLKVPYSLQLASDNLVPELKDLLSDEVGDAGKLAAVVLFERRMGNEDCCSSVIYYVVERFSLWSLRFMLMQDSGWAPYIRRLPCPEEMHCTIFWSDDELELIRQSSVYQETINQRSQIEKEFLAIRMALKNFPEMFKSITYKDFMHAYGLVTSRAWGSTKGYSLIPFADFLNHDGTSESIVLSDNDKHFSEVIADRNYAPGEENLVTWPKKLQNMMVDWLGVMLLSKLTELAEDCEASIKSLGPVSSPVTCERLSIWRQMAQDLLNGELCILKSASAWLRNYCDTLTTTDCHR